MMKNFIPEKFKARNEFRELALAVSLLSVMLLTYI
jgi:hypothetical protein